jgi:hypothetical protein
MQDGECAEHAHQSDRLRRVNLGDFIGFGCRVGSLWASRSADALLSISERSIPTHG